MNEYLIDLSTSFRNIQVIYFDQNVIHSLEGIQTDHDIERVVLAEFYHQWRKLMDDNPIRYRNLILHTEIGKSLANNQEIKHPDLVLHGVQKGPNKLTLNKVFVELKLSDFDSDDISKCFFALRNHNYEYAVCIIIDFSIELFIKSCRENIEIFRHNQEYFKRFYYMSLDDSLTNLTLIIPNL